jgi:hypothetical protein
MVETSSYTKKKKLKKEKRKKRKMISKAKVYEKNHEALCAYAFRDALVTLGECSCLLSVCVADSLANVDLCLLALSFKNIPIWQKTKKKKKKKKKKHFKMAR